MGRLPLNVRRRASLGDGEECVDESKLVVTRKPQNKRVSVAVTGPGVSSIGPKDLTILLSYLYASPSVNIY